MPARLRQLSASMLCAVWTACGLLLPLMILDGGLQQPTNDVALLTIGLMVMAAIFSQVRFEFSHRDHRLEISPDVVFLVAAAVLLPAPQAALVAVLGSWFVLRRWSGWRLVFFASNTALAAGAASLAVHSLVAATPTGRLVLPAVILAATINHVLALAGHFLFEQARSPGEGMQLLRTTPIRAVSMLNIGLPVAAVAIAAPFLDDPATGLVVLLATEGFTWAVLRMLHDEYRQRQQNVYLRDTFSRYMPLPVANQLLESSEQIELGGQQREITVLFCDVREFTAWAEQNQPDEVIAELNLLLTDLSEAIISTNGTLDKFTGDGLMAFWGAPDPQQDHAARALKAVPQILMRVREFNMRRQAVGKPPLEVGIGINSGLAMVGNVGHTNRLNYTAVGDTVNLAARLEGATKEIGCPMLISEATFLALPLGMQKQLARLESINVKGRRDRVRLYTLTSLQKYRASTQADVA